MTIINRQRTILLAALAGALALSAGCGKKDAGPAASATADAKPAAGAGTAAGAGRPNILVIFGDDVGYWNASAYNRGMMGYRTPNIDRIAHEGAIFTDAYAQQSCTAGRAAFITGQSPIRTGLTKVGLPGAPEGLSAKDPTLAEMLKAKGYATGQFGKNHLGDRNEFIPTVHGFDEFFGNFYHLNAEEEPENPDYPKASRIARTPVRSTRSAWRRSTTRSPTPPRTSSSARTPTASPGSSGSTPAACTCGRTCVRRRRTRPASASTPTAWSSTMLTSGRCSRSWTSWASPRTRSSLVVRWPGVIKPGTKVNDIISHEDWVPTLMAAVGEPDLKNELLGGEKIGGTEYKVHLDGYNLMPAFQGQGEWPRKEFLYWTDDGNVAGLRYDRWKLVFMEQRAESFEVWEEPLVTLRTPKLFDLRADPFERADHDGIGYKTWRFERVFLLAPAQVYVKNWLSSFKDFPPRQKPGSFNLSDAMDKLSESGG